MSWRVKYLENENIRNNWKGQFIGYEFESPVAIRKLEMYMIGNSRSSETPVNFDSDVYSRKDGSCGVSRADFTAFGNTVKNYCNDRGSDVSKKICDTIILEYASTKEGPWVSIGKYPGRISD